MCLQRIAASRRTGVVLMVLWRLFFHRNLGCAGYKLVVRPLLAPYLQAMAATGSVVDGAHVALDGENGLPHDIINIESDAESEPVEDFRSCNVNSPVSQKSDCFHVDVDLLSKEVLTAIRDVKDSVCNSLQSIQDALECLDMEDLKISMRQRRCFRGHVNLLRGILVRHVNALDRMASRHLGTMQAGTSLP